MNQTPDQPTATPDQPTATPDQPAATPDQPLGAPVEFTGAAAPGRRPHRGRYATVRPLEPDADAATLYTISHAPTGDPSIWTYLYDGPYPSIEPFQQALHRQAAGDDPLFFSITSAGDEDSPRGIVTYMSIVPEHGTIELGNIWFGPRLKRTPAATEAIFLLARHAFDDLGYRRLEWKCNALNAPSRAAALRFGFSYEGVFHNHRVVKGRNRDTAWYAITDARWPALRAAFETWLDPSNFDADGAQRRRLTDLMDRTIGQETPGPDRPEG
jgi:RimJ/RimL family protein N-acetyltransferase